MKKKLMLGLVLSAIAVIVGLALWQYSIDNRTKHEISRRVDENPFVESLGYDKLKVGIWENRFHLKNVSLKLKGVNETIRAEEIKVFNIKINKGHLLHMNLEIDGLGIPLKSFISNKQYQAAETISEKELLSNVVCFYEYDPDRKILNLESIKIVAPELAKLEARIKLINIDPSAILASSMAELIFQLPGISISQADIIYNDQSLFEKIITMQKKQNRPPLSDALESISENTHQMLRKEKNEKTRAVLEKLLKFFNNPEKINITLAPEKPIPISRFLWVRDLNEIVHLLNLRIDI